MDNVVLCKCVLDKTKTSPSLAFLRFLFWSWWWDLRVVTFVPSDRPSAHERVDVDTIQIWRSQVKCYGGRNWVKCPTLFFWQDHCMHERWLEWCLTCSIKIECHLQPQSTLIFSLIISLSLKWWRWGFCRWNSRSACRTRPISGTPSILTKRNWKGRQTTSKNWSNKSNLSSTPQKVSSKGPNYYGTIFCLESSQVLQVKPCFTQAFYVVWRASVLQVDQKACFAFYFFLRCNKPGFFILTSFGRRKEASASRTPSFLLEFFVKIFGVFSSYKFFDHNFLSSFENF